MMMMIIICCDSGDVVLWNLADEDSITPIQICTHGDTVTSLLWKTRTINDPHFLITSSADGYIFIHKLTANFTMSSLCKRFVKVIIINFIKLTCFFYLF